jgi:hypothetical protein
MLTKSNTSFQIRGHGSQSQNTGKLDTHGNDHGSDAPNASDLSVY